MTLIALPEHELDQVAVQFVQALVTLTERGVVGICGQSYHDSSQLMIVGHGTQGREISQLRNYFFVQDSSFKIPDHCIINAFAGGNRNSGLFTVFFQPLLTYDCWQGQFLPVSY